VEFVVDLPVARYAVTERDRADLIDVAHGDSEGKSRATFGSQIHLTFEIDVVRGRPNVDAVEAAFVKGCDDGAHHPRQAAGFEKNRFALGPPDDFQRAGFVGARCGPSEFRFDEFDFDGKQFFERRLVGMISRVAEFQGADGENRHSEVLGHEEELRIPWQPGRTARPARRPRRWRRRITEFAAYIAV